MEFGCKHLHGGVGDGAELEHSGESFDVQDHHPTLRTFEVQFPGTIITCSQIIANSTVIHTSYIL